jgi:hypothetical protein
MSKVITGVHCGRNHYVSETAAKKAKISQKISSVD